MIYLAQIRFGSRLEEKCGEFSFITEATSREEAEMKLIRLLTGAVKNADWFPAPCLIHIARVAAVSEIPSTGIAFYHRMRTLGQEFDFFRMPYLPPKSVEILHDWDRINFFKESPIAFAFVERDRTLSFPTENVPPELW
jgi:hypothetical protein